MSPFLHFFRDAVFDPETVEKLARAYELASERLYDGNERPSVVSEVIAGHIIAAAENGERDPERLAGYALEHLGIRLE